MGVKELVTEMTSKSKEAPKQNDCTLFHIPLLTSSACEKCIGATVLGKVASFLLHQWILKLVVLRSC